MILYVRKNEEASCVKMVHFVDDEKGIPSELEANAKSMNPSLTFSIVPDVFQSWMKHFLK